MATLAQEIQALLQSLPGVIPEARGLPAIAPQSVQSGNPTPQNVGQTLGPQPGDPRNVSRQQWMQDFGQAAGSFGASAADPLGIPSALLGTVAPGARDSWRQYQGAAGPVVQMAGGMASGFPAANAMIRGGSAMAGLPGMIGGGAATGAGPAIDYAAGAPGASAENAMIGPVVGAAFPVGASVARPVADMMRSYGLPAAGLAAGGALMASVGDAEAQQKQQKRTTTPRPAQGSSPAPQTATGAPVGQPAPSVNEYTQTLIANNPTLASRHRDLQAAEQALATAEQNYTANGSVENRRIVNDRRRAVQPLREAFEQELTSVTNASRGQNPTFREQFGPIVANNMVRQIGIPFAFGLLGGAGSAARQRYTTGAINRMVDEGNDALTRGNTALAQRLATDASQTLNPTVSRPRQVWNAMTAAGSYAFPAAIGLEGALAPAQWNQGLPQGHPEQMAAQQYMSSPDAWRDAGIGALFGLTGYKGGRFASTNAMAMIPGGVSPAGRVTSLETRANQTVAQPPPQPPTAPPVQPPANNMPVDYEAIARGIRPQFDRPPFVPPAAAQPANNMPLDFEAIIRSIGEQGRRGVRGPIGSNPAAPGLSYDAGSNSANMFRQAVAEHLRSGNLLTGFNASDFRRRVVEAAQSAGATEAQVPSVRVFRDALDRLQQLIASEGLSPAQAARRITATNRRGGFENFAVPVMAGGGAAAAHHSASQPRGDDGRFTTP